MFTPIPNPYDFETFEGAEMCVPCVAELFGLSKGWSAGPSVALSFGVCEECGSDEKRIGIWYGSYIGDSEEDMLTATGRK